MALNIQFLRIVIIWGVLGMCVCMHVRIIQRFLPEAWDSRLKGGRKKPHAELTLGEAPPQRVLNRQLQSPLPRKVPSKVPELCDYDRP